MAIFTAIAALSAGIATFLSASFGISAAVAATIGTALVNAAIGVGLSLISRALLPKTTVPQAEIQAVINQTDAPRRVYVGQYLAGGIRAFFDVKSGRLYQLVLVSHGKLTEFVEFWIDGEKVEVDIDGNVTTSKYVVPGMYGADFVNVQTRNGSANGGDYADLISKFASWDTDRKIEKQATFLATLLAPRAEDFSKIFPKGSDTAMQWVVKGQEIYDPRDPSTGYTDNAALVIGHYLTHPDGYRLATDEVNWTSVAAMADVADVAVPQLAGGTAPSLRLWGYWTMDEGPVNVLDRMHGSSGIRAYEMQDGLIGLIGGNFGTPACTLTAKDIKQIRTSEAISEREGYNILRVFHLDPAQKYEVIEVDSWKDPARLAVEGEIVKEYRLEMCPNLSQARRLAKQQLHNGNRARVEIITNLVGLKARFPRFNGQRHTIMLNYRPEDGSGRIIQGEYEVMNHEFDPIGLECRIELERISRTSEAWTPAEEGGTTNPLPPGEPNLAPDIDAILTQRVIQVSAESSIAVLEIDAVPIPDRGDIMIQARFRKTGSTQWIDMPAIDYNAQSGAVEDGQEYEAQVRFNGIFDEPDAWEDLGPVTIQIDATPPGTPTELFASNGTGHVHLSWRNPSGTFFALRVYRSTGTVFGGATLVGTTGGAAGQISEYQDGTIAAATEYNYWIAAANVSGVEGVPVGPANITTP